MGLRSDGCELWARLNLTHPRAMVASDSTWGSVLHKPVRILSRGSEPQDWHTQIACALGWAPREQT